MLYCVGHGSIHLRQLKSVEEGTIQVQLKNFVWFLENIFFYNLSVKIILNDFIYLLKNTHVQFNFVQNL